MNDYTSRSMYTERAPGGINIYAMSDNLTTQEMSKEEKQRLANRLSYQRNREKRKKACRDYYNRNHERSRSLQRKYCEENKELLILKHKEYYKKNREKILYRNREYHSRNKEKIRLTAQIYTAKKRKTDPYYKIVSNLRTRLYGAVKQQLTGKSNPTLQLLGCSVEELVNYIEKQFEVGMSWDNYGRKGWHIDHIKPCNVYDLTDPEQQKQCFHYTNLRPLWAEINWSRPDDGSDLH